MAEPNRTSERSTEERAADHAALAALADTLVPALVAKLGQGSLGEIEIHEDAWTIRVRRSPAGARKLAERPRHAGHAVHGGPQAPAAPSIEPTAPASAPADPRRAPVLAPAVGVFTPGLSSGTRVRAGDRIAVVDLLGIAQDVVAPIDGTIAEVHAKAGDGVEYGEEVAIVEADVLAAALRPAPDGEG